VLQIAQLVGKGLECCFCLITVEIRWFEVRVDVVEVDIFAGFDPKRSAVAHVFRPSVGREHSSYTGRDASPAAAGSW
jgi:hypothetical protein